MGADAPRLAIGLKRVPMIVFTLRRRFMLNTGGCSLAMRSSMAERSLPDDGSSCTRPKEKKNMQENRELVI